MGPAQPARAGISKQSALRAHPPLIPLPEIREGRNLPSVIRRWHAAHLPRCARADARFPEPRRHRRVRGVGGAARGGEAADARYLRLLRGRHRRRRRHGSRRADRCTGLLGASQRDLADLPGRRARRLGAAAPAVARQGFALVRRDRACRLRRLRRGQGDGVRHRAFARLRHGGAYRLPRRHHP